MIDTTDPRLLPTNFDPSDGASQDPQSPGESPGGGGGSLSLSDSSAALTAAPVHCQHLAACATSTCSACEPRWRGMAGLSMAEYLHDDPAEFLTLFQALSERNKEETYAAIASFSGCDAGTVQTFIARSRARALACGVLAS
jgi:hypothetical protein